MTCLCNAPTGPSFYGGFGTKPAPILGIRTEDVKETSHLNLRLRSNSTCNCVCPESASRMMRCISLLMELSTPQHCRQPPPDRLIRWTIPS